MTFLACYFYIWALIRLENSDPNLRAVGRFLLKCLVATSSLKIQDGYNEKMLEKVGMLHFDTQGQIVWRDGERWDSTSNQVTTQFVQKTKNISEEKENFAIRAVGRST